MDIEEIFDLIDFNMKKGDALEAMKVSMHELGTRLIAFPKAIDLGGGWAGAAKDEDALEAMKVSVHELGTRLIAFPKAIDLGGGSAVAAAKGAAAAALKAGVACGALQQALASAAPAAAAPAHLNVKQNPQEQIDNGGGNGEPAKQ